MVLSRVTRRRRGEREERREESKEEEEEEADSTDSTDSADEAPVRVRRLRLGRRRKRGSAIRTSGFSPGKSTAGYQCCHLPSKPPTNPLNTEKPCRRKKKEEEDAEDLPGSGLLCYLSDGAALSA